MSEQLFEKYQLIITTLTPLHIGSGGKIREDFDFFCSDGYLFVIDQGMLFNLITKNLSEKLGDKKTLEIIPNVARKTISELIKMKYINKKELLSDVSNLAAYQVKIGNIHSDELKHKEIHQFIKTSDRLKTSEGWKILDCLPYIPGSSIKGSLRSSLLRLLSKDDDSIEINYFKNNDPKLADDKMERRHFIKNKRTKWKDFANYDLWRGVRITDSKTVERKFLELAHGVVYPQKKGKEIPIYFEVIPEGTEFITTLTLDRWLFLNTDRKKRSGDLKFSQNQWEMFRDLIGESMIYQDSLSLITEEIKFLQHLDKVRKFNDRQALEQTMKVYDRIVKTSLEYNEFIMTLGFGTGWLSKTLGTSLQKKLSDDEFQKMVKAFKLGRKEWQRNQTIPYTRLVVSGDGFTRSPLGWIKVRMDRIE